MARRRGGWECCAAAAPRSSLHLDVRDSDTATIIFLGHDFLILGGRVEPTV